MTNLIKLSNTGKYFYSSEFYFKHREHLNRIEAWHAECIKKQRVDTTKVSRPKTRKVSI